MKIPSVELLVENLEANTRKTVAALQCNLMAIFSFIFDFCAGKLGNFGGVEV